MPRYTVVRNRDHSIEAWEVLEPVFKEYAKIFQKSILVQNPHGRASKMLDIVPTKLNVLFWSAPEDTSGVKIRSAFGIAIAAGQMDGYQPVPDYPTLYDGDGIAVAQVVEPNILHILFDLPHIERYRDDAIPDTYATLLRNILELYREYLKNPDTDGENQRLLSNIKRLLNGTTQNRRNQLARKIADYESSIANHSSSINMMLSELFSQRNELKQLEAGLPDAERLAENQVKSLRKLKGITRIDRTTNGIVFTTEPVQLTTEQATYDIGVFQIKYQVGSPISVRNITNRVGQYDHPHVMNGNICAGNLEDIYSYVAQGDYALATNLILELLHTVYPRGQYIPVDVWPKAKEKKDELNVVEDEDEDEEEDDDIHDSDEPESNDELDAREGLESISSMLEDVREGRAGTIHIPLPTLPGYSTVADTEATNG